MRISDWSSDVCSSDLQEAISIRAEGQKEAQIIRGAADGEAARIYAASYGKDPEFYDFYRAMQSYRQTFLGETNQGGTSIIMSPDTEYLKRFSSGCRGLGRRWARSLGHPTPANGQTD